MFSADKVFDSELKLSLDPNDYQVVLLQNPYASLNDPQVLKLFSRVMALKCLGYFNEYQKVTIPFDASDFLGMNLVVCTKVEEDLLPVCAYRSVTYAIFKGLGMNFPPLEFAKECMGPNDYTKVSDIINGHVIEQRQVSYDSSWTAIDAARKNKNVIKMLLEMTTMIGANYHLSYEIPSWFTNGVPRVRTDKFFQNMGLSSIGDNRFKNPCLHNEECVMFFGDSYSEYSYEMIHKYEDLWSRRMMLGELSSPAQVKKIA